MIVNIQSVYTCVCMRLYTYYNTFTMIVKYCTLHAKKHINVLKHYTPYHLRAWLFSA